MVLSMLCYLIYFLFYLLNILLGKDFELLSLIDRKSNDFRNIGRLIHELSDIDKSGTIFRYSYYFSKRNRIPSKSLNMMIDNKHLYRIMTQMFRFLEGLNDDIRNALDEFNSYNVNF